MPQTFVLIHSRLVGVITWSLVAGELHHRGVATVVPSLSDARCSSGPFLQRYAWPVRELAGGHFHMLVDPAAVTDTLLDLVRELGV